MNFAPSSLNTNKQKYLSGVLYIVLKESTLLGSINCLETNSSRDEAWIIHLFSKSSFSNGMPISRVCWWTTNIGYFVTSWSNMESEALLIIFLYGANSFSSWIYPEVFNLALVFYRINVNIKSVIVIRNKQLNVFNVIFFHICKAPGFPFIYWRYQVKVFFL